MNDAFHITCRKHIKKRGLLELTAVCDHHPLRRGAALASNSFDFTDNLHSAHDTTKDDMFSIKPFGLDCGDEELASIRVWSSVRH